MPGWIDRLQRRWDTRGAALLLVVVLVVVVVGPLPGWCVGWREGRLVEDAPVTATPPAPMQTATPAPAETTPTAGASPTATASLVQTVAPSPTPNPRPLTLEKRIELEDEYRKTFTQILGGVVLLIGVIFTWLNSQANIRNSRASEQKNVIDSDRLLTERFTKAVEQLGSEKLEVRLGAIYALERIAHDSERDHWTIMETLTAYIRERSPAPVRPTRQEKEGTSRQPPPPLTPIDVVAAFTVICRRKHERDQGRRLDLRRICLNFADDRWQEWSDVRLERADLSGAWLSHVEFSDGWFEFALFFDAELRLVHFYGPELKWAHFRGAYLEQTTFNSTSLEGANFEHTHLDGAYFVAAHLERASFAGAQMEEVYFWDAHLEGADLGGALGLTQAQLAEAFTDESTKLPDYLITAEQPVQAPDVSPTDEG
jgi:hypothetical protein